eukprot:TRINITY_DN2859_c0_g2_i1.p2 TRINITY_DN2859_c0_g2~~TRINITY_DN2859_c0_g2_i1.p2  ORF type:complete len:147 (-),score=43.27 TRINITY_DN2859_c0_g2_i1:245-685(-)
MMQPQQGTMQPQQGGMMQPQQGGMQGQQSTMGMQATMVPPPPAPAPMPPPSWAASQTNPAAPKGGALPPIQNHAAPPATAPAPTPAMLHPTPAAAPTRTEPAADSPAVQEAVATEQKLDGDVNDILADFDNLMQEMDSTQFDNKPK